VLASPSRPTVVSMRLRSPGRRTPRRARPSRGHGSWLERLCEAAAGSSGIVVCNRSLDRRPQRVYAACALGRTTDWITPSPVTPRGEESIRPRAGVVRSRSRSSGLWPASGGTLRLARRREGRDRFLTLPGVCPADRSIDLTRRGSVDRGCWRPPRGSCARARRRSTRGLWGYTMVAGGGGPLRRRVSSASCGARSRGKGLAE